MSSEPDPRPQRTAAPRLGWQPALDGLRGFAVLIVLCHNLGWPGFKGGFLGVDMFFALSGFLITTLLLEDNVRHGRISLRQFFRRRFLRLYPALVVLMAFSALSAVFDSRTVPLSRVVAVSASVLGYWSNWQVIADPAAWFGGLNHTWSLAVEMHFYILWAVLMALVTGRRGRDWCTLGLLALGLAAGSALWRGVLWGLHTDTNRLYAGTDVRLDAVFLGAFAGLLRWRQLAGPGQRILPAFGPGKVRVLELAAAGLLLVLIVVLPKETALTFLGGFTLAGAATAVLILTALLYDGSLVARVATFPVMVWLGQISYSLYLWHVPAGKLFSVARLARYGFSPVVGEIVRLVASIVIAAASYYGIERYFLRVKDRLQVK